MQRQCEILGLPEERNLREGLDFRLPQYRREVFLRFYEFHLEHRAHPGAVYYVMPWLIKEYGLNQEQAYWMAFINGNTQNIVTTWMFLDRFPDFPNIKGIDNWFNKNYEKLEWDTDRRYHKKVFLQAIECYKRLTDGDQTSYFTKVCSAGDEHENFNRLWKVLRKDFYSFGRLSAFSYSEYLRIIGLNQDCSTLFLDDLSGSKSHRNGLAKVLGRDDRDWHDSGTFDGRYPDGEIAWLGREAALLLEEAWRRTKTNKKIDPRHVSYFTLESAFCTYKSWHRINRRYPNCYDDMLYNRIKRAEGFFGEKEFEHFWDCREDCLPQHLRLECCPNDPGLCPEKQNWYRQTGQVIMMSRKWPEFTNPFDQRIWKQ